MTFEVRKGEGDEKMEWAEILSIMIFFFSNIETLKTVDGYPSCKRE